MKQHSGCFRGFAGPSESGFTLLELLVVVAIIAALYALTLPAVNSMLTSYRLSTAGDMVVGFLGDARHSAITLNQTVEVRFYRYAINGMAGEQPSNPATGKYRAIQLFAFNASGAAVPITKAQQLPNGIILDSGTLSPIISGTTQEKIFNPPLDPQVAIPEAAGSSYACAAYQIYPGATTTLAGQAYVTIHRLIDGDNLTAPPSNYVTIQVDPVSATVRSYRP